MVDQAPPSKKQKKSPARKRTVALTVQSKLSRGARRADKKIRRLQAADPRIAKVTNILSATYHSS
jgi:hypothetical protein